MANVSLVEVVGQDQAPSPVDTLRKRLDDPEVANTTFEGMMGTQTFAEAIDRFICFDLLVHGWDLAHATGLDEAMDPADVERLDQAAKAFGDRMRGPGAFGEAVEPPPGADDQTRVARRGRALSRRCPERAHFQSRESADSVGARPRRLS